MHVIKLQNMVAKFLILQQAPYVSISAAVLLQKSYRNPQGFTYLQYFTFSSLQISLSSLIEEEFISNSKITKEVTTIEVSGFPYQHIHIKTLTIQVNSGITLPLTACPIQVI